eukprot:10356271-Prorocentrum_lima.AAC.1
MLNGRPNRFTRCERQQAKTGRDKTKRSRWMARPMRLPVLVLVVQASRKVINSRSSTWHIAEPTLNGSRWPLLK